MTTIAADLLRGVMCADTQWNDGSMKGRWRKVYRRKGALIGLAGALSEHAIWLKAYDTGLWEDHYPSIHETVAIRLDRASLSTWTIEDGWIKVQEPRWAIGSGASFAIGAMDAGATVEQAIRVALKRDAGTSGRVSRFRLAAKDLR